MDIRILINVILPYLNVREYIRFSRVSRTLRIFLLSKREEYMYQRIEARKHDVGLLLINAYSTIDSIPKMMKDGYKNNMKHLYQIEDRRELSNIFKNHNNIVQLISFLYSMYSVNLDESLENRLDMMSLCFTILRLIKISSMRTGIQEYINIFRRILDDNQHIFNKIADIFEYADLHIHNFEMLYVDNRDHRDDPYINSRLPYYSNLCIMMSVHKLVDKDFVTDDIYAGLSRIYILHFCLEYVRFDPLVPSYNKTLYRMFRISIKYSYHYCLSEVAGRLACYVTVVPFDDSMMDDDGCVRYIEYAYRRIVDCGDINVIAPENYDDFCLDLLFAWRRFSGTLDLHRSDALLMIYRSIKSLEKRVQYAPKIMSEETRKIPLDFAYNDIKRYADVCRERMEQIGDRR